MFTNSNNNIFTNNNKNIFSVNQSTNPFINNDKSSNPFLSFNNKNNQMDNSKNGGFLGINNNQSNLIINNNNINNINNNNNKNNNDINNNYNEILNTNFFTTIIPVIALNENNYIKNSQYDIFPEDIKDAILSLKINLKNQQMKLDELKRYSQRLTNLVEQNQKLVEKFEKSTNSVDEKINKYENKLNQINDNFDLISESFEKESKNIRLMEQNSGFKIEIPSNFLLEYSQNLLNRTILYKQKLDDIITLIRVSCSQNNNDYEFECDIMESTLAEFIKIIKYLLEENSRQEKMVNEILQILLKFAADYGENPEEIYNNVMKYSFEYNNNSS